MGLIAINVLFLFYVPSFTSTFTRHICMHFNKDMLLWDRPEWHKYSGVVQMPTLVWHDANTPTEVTLWLQPASVSLFLKPFDVQSNMKTTNNIYSRRILILDMIILTFNECYQLVSEKLSFVNALYRTLSTLLYEVCLSTFWESESQSISCS